MPKSARKNNGSGVSKSDPYAGAASRKKGHAANNVFKFNTDLGQHILKNPGVAQAIVDKADLKQSDVRPISSVQSNPHNSSNQVPDCPRSRPRHR